MATTKELLDTIRKLSALEARTEDVRRSQERLEDKINYLIDRISSLEAHFENLKSNVKNEILTETISNLTKYQIYFELEKQGILPKKKEDE